MEANLSQNWQECVNFMALPIVVYIRQSAMDALVGSVIFIVRPNGVRVAIDNGIYLERIEFGRALSERSWFSPRLKKSLDYNVRPAPPARVSRRYLPQPARVFKVPSTPRPDCSIFVKPKRV